MSAGGVGRARELFLAACERPPEERRAFLVDACGGDDELYREVEALLSYRDDEEETAVSPEGLEHRVSAPRGERFVPGTVLDERYRIVRLVGRGGMGEVYQADDLRLGVPVALKFLPEWLERASEMRRRFLEEVKLARSITHPNVCRVYDVGEADGHLFISMEYIDGENLAGLLQRIGRLPLAKAVSIVRQVAEGLDAAHRRGILHRDLKPANLMIDADGQARITDFGLAVLDAHLTGAEVMTGTPAYMAPEQLAGQQVSTRSDLYALGLVFYELITGQGAFTGTAGIGELLRRRRETTPVPPTRLVKDLDPAIERVILCLLETEPDDRPATAREVAAALPGGDAPPVLMTLVTTELRARRTDGRIAMPPDRHDEIVRSLAAEHGGREVADVSRRPPSTPRRTPPEAPVAAPLLFERPWHAVCWALAYHRAIEREGGGQLATRVGVHVTEAFRRPDGEAMVESSSLELIQRLTLLARDRQTLLTRGAFDLAREAADGSPRWLAHGAYNLEGREEAIEIFEVGEEGFAPLTPPASSRHGRRAMQEDTILGWRPAAGQAIELRPSWRLERKLAEGGYGEVWLASREMTGERRVFKFCFEARRLKALKREIVLFGLLKEGLGDRDDIARIFDWNFETVPYFIESEYTDGGDLVEWAERQGGLSEVSLETRLSIVAQVAEALSAAHSVGVLHKDVKPANVLIHVDPEKGPRARLADFGIGLLTDETRLATPGVTLAGVPSTRDEGSSSGTPLYRAPELLEGKAATVQADVYALGVTLYQMVVGDFGRALGPGWERDVDDDLLREDIAAAVDKNPRRRLAGAVRLAERLDALAERRRRREAERREKEDAERTRAELERARRRRKLTLAVTAALAIFAGAMAWQAGRVAREAERANREAQTAKQVAGFLVQIFEVSDPESGRGAEITARELLERGAAEVETELKGQPEVQARLMRTIGVVYRSLGLYQDAAPLLETTLSIRRQVWGEAHPEIAESLDDLAVLATFAGDYERAEALGREALAMRRRLLGGDHLDVATSLGTLAGVLSQRGEDGAAEELYREALALRRRLLGEDHPDLAENLNSLAAMLEKRKDDRAAEELYREALAMRRRLLGDDHPDVAVSLNNLAGLLASRGDYDAAEKLYREALDLRRRLLGEEHPDLAVSLNNLARLLQLKGDLVSAERLYREALAMRRRLLGEEHPDVATSLISLGWLFWQQGDLDSAEPFYREALAMRRRLLGEHIRVVNSINHLARLLWDKGKGEQAERLYREALDLARRLRGDGHADVAYGLDNLARVVLARGDYEAAESMIREALGILREVLPAGDWRIVAAENELGAALAGLGRGTEAEALLLETYPVLRRLLGDAAPVTMTARRRLAEFYEARGDAGKAASYRGSSGH